MNESVQHSELCIYGGTALTMNGKAEIVRDAVILIKGGNISSIFSESQFEPERGQRSIDAGDCLILPGLINGHTHTGMSLLRGIADDLPLQRWLSEVIFPLERRWVSDEFVFAATLISAVEMIRSGTTTINDMYYVEEAAARALHRAGLRAICGQTIVEISQVDNPTTQIFQEFDGFLSKISSYPLITPAIAPHSGYGVSKDTFKEVIAYAQKRDLLIHFHLAETQEEVDECLKRHSKTPVEYLEDLGLWSCKVVAAHATCVSKKDIEILGRNRAGIAHNPESNLKLGTKICPVVELRESGAHVCLGTDSVASNNNLDLLQEVDTAAKLQTFRMGIGALTAENLVRMLTIDAAKALKMSEKIGSLEVGKAADIIAVDIHNAHSLPLYNPYSHLVYSACGADVKHSVVNGRPLMENFKLNSLDEPSILQGAVEWGKKISASQKIT